MVAASFALPKRCSSACPARFLGGSSFAARTARRPVVKPDRSFGSIWLVLWFTGVGRLRYLRCLIDAELAAVEAFRPDVLFTEVDTGAFVVSRITGVPIACTYASVFAVGVGSFP